MENARRQVRKSLLHWCSEALSSYDQEPAAHHKLIITYLEKIAEGEIDRLMILAPPGSAKSTYATVLFPAWWFCRRPDTAVISASHTGDLAESFGRRVRNLVHQNADLLGYDLADDSRAAGQWNTDKGGIYIAPGVGKAIAGIRADLAVIDDPVKSREAAESQNERDKVWDWYRGDLYNRLKPHARVVLIQTRWHEDDLGGRLLQEMESGGDQWHVLSLPALAESANDPLGRKIGQALWPDWEDSENLNRKRRVIGEREWAAQYQQRPRPMEGAIFMPGKMPVWEVVPALERERPEANVVDIRARRGYFRAQLPPVNLKPKVVRAWDLSAVALVGTRDPDYTVGVKVARLGDGRYAILDIIRERCDPLGVERLLVATAHRDGVEVEVGLAQDPGQAGKSQIAYLMRALAGFVISSSTESGDKTTRAGPVASQVNAGNVAMMRAPWNAALKEEMASFPNGTHDDQIDALSRGFSMVLPPHRDLLPSRPRPVFSIYAR